MSIIKVPKTVVVVPDLTPKRFEYLLALTGLDDIWDALEDATKGVDAVQYATLKAERKSNTFRQAETLAMVAKFRPMAAKLSPDVDLSDEAIKAAWNDAAEYGA
jgi:dihydroorotate dehydrogenase